MKSTVEEIENRRVMHENFNLMQKNDVLAWDSDSVYFDTRELYRIANCRGWKISISCNPPMTLGYRSRVKARITIMRLQ